MNHKIFRYIFSLFLFIFLAQSVFAANSEKKERNVLSKTNGEPVYTRFNVNNISTWIKNDGESDINQNGNSGFVYPKGSNKAAVFQSGFLWGGSVNGNFRVGGSVYRQGLVPGKILPDGTAEDPNNANVRIYRVRPDVKPGVTEADVDVSSEVDDEGLTAEQVIAQYIKDWNEWPAADGAPYEDVNGNGTYESTIDIPGFPKADQTIWFVANDLDPAQTDFMYGSLPMGIEMQATIWGYNTTGALGNTMFRKYKIINKSSSPFDSMYVSMWSDPDLGDASDDYVGCDTTLSLGYCYNGKASDAVYGLTPPAVGFDFFQGPIVPGNPDDEAIFNGEIITGYRNLPMTAFYFFINGDAVYTDPTQGQYTTGTLRWRNLFEGKVSTTGTPFVDPTTGRTTMFTLSGDPTTGQGWVDGILHTPGDRRQGQVAGPFTMAAGETQEVVVAELIAGDEPGVDRLGAIGLLKFYDLQAQLAYDNFFQIPTAPPAPSVIASPLDQEIIIYWGANPAAVEATENYDNGGFKFQGYNVYQLPNSTSGFAAGRRLATYDLVDGIGKIEGLQFDSQSGVVLTKVLQFGTDSGIKRSFSFKNDAFKSNLPIVNGTRYFLAVTSYAFNSDPNAVPNVLENPLAIIEIVPQSSDPGVRYEGTAGDEIEGEQVSGLSDGVVTAIVVDPTKLTGHDYRVFFTENEDGDIVWNLKDETTGANVLTNQTNLSGDDNYLIVDGMQVIVSGPAAEFAGVNEGDGMVEVQYAGTPLTPSQYDALGAPFGGNKVWHSLNVAGGDRYYLSSGGGSYDIDRLKRFITFAVPRDFELRFTEAGGYAVFAFADDKIAKTPFEIWDIGVGTPDDPSDDRRMIPFLNANVATSDVWGYGTGTDGYFGYPMSDWIYWMDPKDKTFGDVGYKQFENSCIQSGDAGAIYNYNFDTDPTAGDYNADFYGGFVYPIGRLTVNDYDQDGNPPPAGTIVRIFTKKPIALDDVFTFKAPAVSESQDLAKEDVNKINVFPNPYYGVNSQEVNKYQRFVTFNHLPQNATIRVFNLSGQLVRTIEKSSPSQFERWDLLNQSGLPVASGLYIVHIDMPDLGTTKILKAAIIQEQQILDRF